jgi:hypothetical protein
MDAGSERAFEWFVRERSAALYRTAYLVTGDAHQAEDLLQSAFERAYRRWRRIRSMEYPEAYVRRMVVNLANDRRRFRRGRDEVALEEARRAMRRRLLVPAVVALVGVLATGSLTLARGRIQPGRSARIEPTSQTTPPARVEVDGGRGQPAHHSDPPAGAATAPAGQPSQAGGRASAEGCVRVRGPLPATVRAALLAEATRVLEAARYEVAGTLDSVERLDFAANSGRIACCRPRGPWSAWSTAAPGWSLRRWSAPPSLTRSAPWCWPLGW